MYTYFAIIDGVDVEGRIKTVFSNSQTNDITSVSYQLEDIKYEPDDERVEKLAINQLILALQRKP